MVMRIITVKIPEELVEKIDRRAIMLGISRSELIRRAIEWYLDEPNKLPYKPRIERIRVVR